jgi:hypothetical protein
VPKAFQWLHQVSLQAVCVEPVEVVAPQICIGAMPLLEVISDHQNAVSDSYDGALPPSPSSKSLKRADRYVFLVRAAAQADWHAMRRNHGLPLRILLLIRLPALSLFPGHTPASWPDGLKWETD